MLSVKNTIDRFFSRKILKLLSKFIILVPIFMSILWTFRQQCSHLIQRHFISNGMQTMANVHIKARKSPYAGTKDVHVRLKKNELK